MDNSVTPDPTLKKADMFFGEKDERTSLGVPGVGDAAKPVRPMQTASVMKYIAEAGKSLVTGLGITLRYFTHPSEIVTAEYPNNRKTLKFPERFRGRVTLPHDGTGEHKCTACTMCEKACPNGSISILPTKNVAGKRVLGKFVYRLSQCTMCNLCIEACPFGAIEMGHDYEMATENKDDLILILNKKEGR